VKVIVIGSFEAHELARLESAVSRGGARAEVIEVGLAEVALGRSEAVVPSLIVVDLTSAGAAEVVPWLRGEARYFAVPVVALVPDATGPAYVEAFGCGADDVIVRSDFAALTRRVESVKVFDPARRNDATRGSAVVAEAEEGRRRLLGRLLRRAGFDVAFASSGNDLVANIATFSDPRLIVISERLPPGGVLTVLHGARAASGDHSIPAVVMAAGATDALERDAARAVNVIVGSETAPLDNLLFLANEVTRTDFSEMRRSARLLFATLCTFRRAGEMSPAHGVVYNISKNGLYVRSLDPPPRETEIWLELCPPRSAEAVHLRCTVMWALRVGSPALPAPPGFGVRIDGARCPPEDLARYEWAYESFA
jgi:CheY-like chemotaxis protein